MKKNYAHHVIRLREGKPNKSKVYWLIVILNTKKASSHGMLERLGFFRYGPDSTFSINYNRLSYYLNKGVELKKSVKRFIHWFALLNKFYNINKKKKKSMLLLQIKNNLIMDEYNYFDEIINQNNSTIILGLDPILDLEILEEKEWYDNLELYEQGGEVDYLLSNEFFIKERKNRDLIPNSFVIHKFLVGDILEFVYFYKSIALTFSGICIAIRKKSFILPDMSLILRNIIIKTGMEITYSYFYNRGYKQKFLDYKRKIFTFNKNKLYFIRDRLNQESRVF